MNTMNLLTRSCRICGGDLIEKSETHYRCRNCGAEYSTEDAQRHDEELRSLFDDFKLEQIANARRNLYKAVNEEYTDSVRVHECCMILKQLYPEDFQANFYEVANGSDNQKIASFILGIDTQENADYMDSAIRFLIRSLQSEFVLPMATLISRAYEHSDPVRFDFYNSELSKEAQKLDDCVYMTNYPRDVFVAYSSKDMDQVCELVEYLESQDLSCFVAARNLRHGKGSVQNYDQALKEAMDNCTTFVLVSSINSRSVNCDVIRKEIPYVKTQDIENAPAEFKNADYSRIPQRYKKQRVEYRIGADRKREIAADRFVNAFFDGYEWVYSPDEVADRILNASDDFSDIEYEPEHPLAAEPKKVKFCKKCETECPANAKFCLECGNSEFAETLREIELERKLMASGRAGAEPEATRSVQTPSSQKASCAPDPKQAADQKYREAEALHRKKDFVPAAARLKEAAASGHLQALALLGEYYLYGKGVAQDDDEAFRLLKEAADRNSERAQVGLGALYRLSKKYLNEEKSREWYEKAALSGNKNAQYQLGNSFSYGYYGAAVDRRQAFKWYEKAANQGHAAAQFRLGYYYQRGYGVKADNAEAARWYTKAQMQGYAPAAEKLKEIR